MLYYECFIPVRYYETDKMGIVHHSNYIRYFECARIAMLEEYGYPVAACERDGCTLPIISIACNYKYPTTIGDTLRVTVMIENLPTAKLKIKQQVFNQDNILCAEGHVVLAFLDAKTNRPRRCPERFVEVIQARINDR